MYKLCRVCRVGPDSAIDPRQQVSFYDPGLGTDGSATGFLDAYRRLQKLLSSVTGLGITKNIADCYEFLVNHFEPGDRIYLVGFSRGAYTARCVANVLFLCGVPTTAPGGFLPRFRRATRAIAEEAVMQVYEYGAGSPRGQYQEERFELARRFRRKYGSGDELRSNVAPHFIGVFDTVASLGATGPRRWGIAAGLALLAALVAAVPAALLDLSSGTGFWGPFAAILGLVGAFVLWRWLPTAVQGHPRQPGRRQDPPAHRAVAVGQLRPTALGPRGLRPARAGHRRDPGRFPAGRLGNEGCGPRTGRGRAGAAGPDVVRREPLRHRRQLSRGREPAVRHRPGLDG